VRRVGAFIVAFLLLLVARPSARAEAGRVAKWNGSCDPATQTSDETLSGKMGVFPTSRVLIDSPIGTFSPLRQVPKRHETIGNIFPASRMAISGIVNARTTSFRESQA
jgi:hypothetical protein